jgi:hypothetical protein
MLFLAAVLCLAGLFVFHPKISYATNPGFISFQGKVVNADGTNVTNGTYPFDFILWDDPTAGTNRWQELSKSVVVTNGVFQTNLGSATALPDFNTYPNLYLAIRFNTDAQGYMTPRVQLTSVPYAINSDKLGGLTSASFGQLSTTNAWTNTNSVKVASATAFQVQNSGSNGILTVDTSGGQVLLGTLGGSGVSGTLVFNSATAGNYAVTLETTSSQAASYTLKFPTATPSTGKCLQTSAGDATQMTFDSCGSGGSGVTTVGTFSGSSQTNGASIAGTTITFGPADATNPGMVSTGTQTITGDKTLKSTTNSTTAFQIQNSTSGQIFNVDTSGSNITLNGLNSGETGAWATNSSNPLPDLRQNHSSVVANGYVYVIGGQDSGITAKSTVYYAKLNADGSTGTWQTNANPLPYGRYSLTSVVANGYIYAIGGEIGGIQQSSVYYAKLNADGSTGTWQTNANVIPGGGRWGHSSVVANGYVYVIGGFSSASTVYYAKLNADGSTGAWQTNANVIPDGGRYMHSSIVANGYVYVIGGQNTGTYAPQSTVYYAKLNADGSTGTWQTNANPLLATIEAPASVVANGHVYVIGGWGGTTQSTVYYAKLNADGSTGSWTTNVNALPDARYAHSSVLANGYVYVIGGSGGGGAAVSTVYYASTSRIQMAGSLDLVGLSGQNLSDPGDFSQGSTGGSLTAGNTSIIGALNVQGQTAFAQGMSIDKELRVGGSTLFQNTTDSTAAFQVKDASGTSLLTADTTNSRVSVGSIGTATGQLYVAGKVPVDASGGGANINSGAKSVFVSGRYAYVGYASGGLQAFDVSNPTNPVAVGLNSDGNTVQSVYISGRYAYGVNAGNVLKVYDISNPTILDTGAAGALASGGHSIYVSGRYAYITTQNVSKLQIFDISNPYSPVDLTSGGVGTSGYAVSVFVLGKYAYVTNASSNTLQVFDVSNPSSPTDISSGGANTASYPRAVYVSGRYAYVTIQNDNKLQIFDVSNPASPTDVTSGGVATAMAPYSIYVAGRYAYVADYSDSKLQVFDVSNPSSPTDISSGGVSTATGPNSVYINGRYAYVVGDAAKLQVFDLGGEYAQQLEAGGAEVGSLQVDTNAQVAGDASIQGGLSVGQSLQVSGNMGLSSGNLMFGSSTAYSVTLATSSSQAASYTLKFPTATPATGKCLQTSAGDATQLTFDSCGTSGTFLAKNATDTSSADASTGYLYGFTNSNAGSTGGVLSLTNGANTGDSLYATASGNPTSGKAVIFASNTNASPSGNLIDLQSGSSPTSKFSVSAAGVVAAASTVTGTTLNGTTGVNTGSGSGTQRIDSSGNLVSIGNITGVGAITLQPAAATALTITAHATSIWSTDTGNLTVQSTAAASNLYLDAGTSGSGTVNVANTNANTLNIAGNNIAHTIHIGDGGSSTAQSITIGSTGSTSTLTLQGGVNSITPTISIQAAASGYIAMGTTNANTLQIGAVGSTANATTVNIANTSGNATQTVAIGSNGNTSNVIDIDAGTGATGIEIGNTTTAHGIQIGSNATGANAIKLGGANASSTVTIEGGTAATAIQIGNGSTAHGIQIGSNASGVQTITIGNAVASSALTLTAGTGNMALNTTSGTITLQSTTAGQINLKPGGTSNISIGTSDTTGTLLVLDTDTDAAYSAGSATNSQTEIDGAMFYSTVNHAFMCGMAGAWETCTGLLYSNTSVPSAVNTCTTACGNIGAAPIPANYCKPGRVIHIIARGVFGTYSTAPTLILGFYYGTSATRGSNTSVGGVSPTFTPAASLSGLPWSIDYTLICLTTASMNGAGILTYQNSATATTTNVMLQMPATTTSSLTTTSTANLYLFPQFGTSNAASTITGSQYFVSGY